MAHNWYALNLGDPLLADPEIDRITQIFHSHQIQNPGAEGRALFIRHESVRLHCNTVIFFPPACATLARQLGARLCAPPARQDLGLLAGEENAWSTCFPK